MHVPCLVVDCCHDALQASKGPRIKQGAPDEDAALAQHLLAMQPRLAQLQEIAQLAELLVLLGHEGDARVLQQVNITL